MNDMDALAVFLCALDIALVIALIAVAGSERALRDHPPHVRR
jgi:hypothetical protein